MSLKTIPTIHQFLYKQHISTRWRDNDVYGHVNNVVYYSWFDTVVNGYLFAQKVLDYKDGNIVGLVVETQCNYFKPVAFPDEITAALAVAKVGNSSVRYEVGIFNGDEADASAAGHFVHVYVDAMSHKPVPVPGKLRTALAKIQR